MSTASQASHAADAARAVRHVDDGIGNWLKDLVTGAGSSPSHIIITGILGVVPGVGQVMDARDIILAIIQIAKTPAAVGGWVELVITLIGCVPAVGDSLKVGFKLMTKGHNFGRVLEAVSPALRGNIEKYMRKIDWSAMTHECKGLFSKTIAAFIDGLDSWIVKAIGGRKEVKMVIEELQALQKSGNKMIDAAFAELKEMHSKMMGHQLAGSTAAVGTTSSRAVKHEVPSAAATTAAKKPVVQAQKKEAKVAAKKSQDVKSNSTPANSTKVDKKKAGKPKKQKWSTGVPAEHITDYFVKHKHIPFNKVNNNGKLTEEYSLPHNGLDHLWSNKPNLQKPFVVGETKSSVFDSLRLIAALPADLREKFEALRADDAKSQTSNKKPNIFDNEGRDAHANQAIQIGDSDGEHKAVRNGVNKPGVDKHGKPTGLPTQMSHEWITYVMADERLTLEGRKIRRLLEDNQLNGGIYPYQRWISLVTGRQLRKHQKSKGSHHEVQVVLHLPDNILLK
jgi:hypothetical protein